MSKRTEVAAQYMACLRDSKVDEALTLLADDVMMTGPRMGSITGRSSVEQVLRRMPAGGGGKVKWAAPKEDGDTVRVEGSAGGGPIRSLISKLMGVRRGIAMVFGFSADDKINRIEVVLA